MDPSDVAKVVEDLAGRGHVERARDAGDRRRVSVALTAAGRAALTSMDAAVSEAEDVLLAPLTLAERTQLAQMLSRVYAHGALRREGDTRVVPTEGGPAGAPVQ
jgi:DNA-binding MarR family transcriptional regulator